MSISALLKIKPGVTAIIGGGGKTTLMFALAEELKLSGRVIVSTSTKTWRPTGFPVLSGGDSAALADELRRSPIVCAGIFGSDGKLTAPACSFERLKALARYVLVEADGSKGLPMKAHAPYEPVIPDTADKTILVMGADGFGQTIRQAAHRPALYAKLAGAGEDDIITPYLAARVARAEQLHNCVLVNKVESETALAAAKELQILLECPVYAGSLHNGVIICLSS